MLVAPIKDRASEAVVVAPGKVRSLDRASRRKEETLDKSALRAGLDLQSSRANSEQVLQFYVFNSSQDDVNYFFDGYGHADWRITELVPLAMSPGLLGDTTLELFAALHRLRQDSKRHLLNYNNALCSFGRVLRTPPDRESNWLHVLGCIMLLAQYDVNACRGRGLATHLRAAARLLHLNRRTETRTPRETMQRRTLTRITMIYDLQHHLVSGDALHLPISLYETMHATARPYRISGEWRTSLDQLWSKTHLLWARFGILTSNDNNNNGLEYGEIESICGDLRNLLLQCKHNYVSVDKHSPLHAYCPFGETIIYKTPALRLVNVNLHALVLMLCSWYPTGVSAKFDMMESRNHILQAHAPLFAVSKSAKRRSKESQRFVHHAFPAILQLMLAASEVGPEDDRGQEWIALLMASAREHGYTLGEVLLSVLQSNGVGNDRGWQQIGTKSFLKTCRFLRAAGLA